MTNILFLDIDGPLIPTRLHVKTPSGLFYYDHHPTMTKVMDAPFIKYLNDVLPVHKYQIVFNTAHNDFGKDYILNHAIDNGFDMKLIHDDCMTKYPYEIYNRMRAIEEYISRHPIKNWIVVDDVYIADGINHIRPTLSEGMTKDLILELDDLLTNTTF